MDVPSIQVGGVPVINLNSPQPTYPAQTYTAHPVQQQQQPPSYHNQHQSSAVSPGAQGHAPPQAYIPQHVLPKPNDQRAMSVEMMDVGGLSLSSSSSNPASASTSASTQGYVGYKPESMQDGNGDGPGGVQSPVPQGQVRQPSAEEERLKDKVREAQEQVRTLPVSVGLFCWCSHAKRKLSPLYCISLSYRPLKHNKHSSMPSNRRVLPRSTPWLLKRLSSRLLWRPEGRRGRPRHRQTSRLRRERRRAGMRWRISRSSERECCLGFRLSLPSDRTCWWTHADAQSSVEID